MRHRARRAIAGLMALVGLSSPALAQEPIHDFSGVLLHPTSSYFAAKTNIKWGAQNPAFLGAPGATPGSQVTVKFDSYSLGGRLGYQQQFGRWVLGGHLDLTGKQLGGGNDCAAGGGEGPFTVVPGSGRCKNEVRYTVIGAGRLGYVWGKVHTYGLLGYALVNTRTRLDTTLTDGVSTLLDVQEGRQHHRAMVAGIGLEYHISSSFTLRLEYKHIFASNATHDIYRTSITTGQRYLQQSGRVNLDPDVVGATLSFKLGQPAATSLAAVPPGDVAPVQPVSAPVQAASAPPAAPQQAAAAPQQQTAAARPAARAKAKQRAAAKRRAPPRVQPVETAPGPLK